MPENDKSKAAMDIGMFVLNLLLKAGPALYAFIKNEIDGGADAEKLRKEPVTLSIAFGGGEGKAIVVQHAVESEMLDPNAD